MSQDDGFLSIPFPRTTQNVHRGYAKSPDYKKAVPTKPTTIRFNDEERWYIDGVAGKLGMTFGEFVRWCAHYAAIEVNNELERATFSDRKKRREPVIDTSGYK